MKLHNGVWFPDDESDEAMLFGGRRYQELKLNEALRWCKASRRVAVDVGAHCGLWSVQLSLHFREVVSFEPLPRHIECFEKNVEPDVTLHKVALGEKEDTCGMVVVEKLSGRSHLCDGTDYPVKTLDSYRLEEVDFIKIDVEGYELSVLKGAVDTIQRCSPVIIVEQKKGHAQRYGFAEKEALTFLQIMGMRIRGEIAGDYIMSFP